MDAQLRFYEETRKGGLDPSLGHVLLTDEEIVLVKRITCDYQRVPPEWGPLRFGCLLATRLRVPPP
jgi:hypothetical protein